MAELGAVASVIAIAGTGAKLSIACIEFASNIGSAGAEIVAVGTEISQFCVVLKQIEVTLIKAKKTVRYSLTAILAIESITHQCRPVFQEIESILDGLKKDNKEPNFLSRLAWVLKRSKVQLLRKTLESSKLTLSCMLMTLLFAENIASRNESTVETRQEDEHQQAVTESLLLARECSVAELERLEDEDINANDSAQRDNPASSHARSLSTDAVPKPRTQQRNNRRSAVMDGAFIPSIVDPRNTPGNRSSLLLNSVLLDDSSPIAQQLANLDISQKRNSQPVELLKRWTNDGHRLSKLVESPEDLRDSPNYEGAEATAVPDALGPSSEDKRETWATLSSRGGFEFDVTPPSPPMDALRKREALRSTLFRPLIIQCGDEMGSFRLTKNHSAEMVRFMALERYHHPWEWSKYDLFVEYGVHPRQCRRLDPMEYPLRLFDQLDQESKAPIFKLLRAKEEQLRIEEEKLREIETRVQREISEKRQLLLAKEAQLRDLEARLEREQNGQISDRSPIPQPVNTTSSLLATVEASIPQYHFKDNFDTYILYTKMEDNRSWKLCRHYLDFYDLQTSLIKRFPVEAGQKGKRRTLPYMPGPVTHVTDAISSARRANLDKYLKELLLMPPHVSQSSIVRLMLMPREGDEEVSGMSSDS